MKAAAGLVRVDAHWHRDPCPTHRSFYRGFKARAEKQVHLCGSTTADAVKVPGRRGSVYQPRVRGTAIKLIWESKFPCVLRAAPRGHVCRCLVVDVDNWWLPFARGLEL